jgi:hypothetical protein
MFSKKEIMFLKVTLYTIIAITFFYMVFGVVAALGVLFSRIG